MSSNSVEVMAKANTPGMSKRGIYLKEKIGWAIRAAGDSKRMCDRINETNITGARWKSVLNEFLVAGVCWRRSCVRDHRRPDNADAVMTSANL